MCRILKVARAGFYDWLHKPLSDRAMEDQRLLSLIRDSYVASGGVYGSPRVFADLREAGQTCGKHRVARIMQTNRIKAIRGYKSPRSVSGRPSILSPNKLNRQFTVDAPDRVWVALMVAMICKLRSLVLSKWRNLKMVVSSGRRVIPGSSWANCQYMGMSSNASSIAGSDSPNHCYRKWMRNMVSMRKAGRPPLLVGSGLECGWISPTNSVHGTTRFISSRNIRLRVRLVISSYPVVARLICFIIYQRLASLSGWLGFAGFP